MGNGCKWLVVLWCFSLAACSSVPLNSPTKTQRVAKSSVGVAQPGTWEPAPQGGGYYLDDGPGSHRPANLDKLPDPVPAIEPVAKANTRPYVVMEQAFTPQTTLEEPYLERGRASWYGRKFHGAKTANGEIYDMYQMTAAHPTLPLPSYARVTNLSNGKSVIVRVNDRGPFLRSRIMDLSYAAAFKLGYVGHGSTEVTVEKLTPELIAQYQSTGSTKTIASAPTTVARVIEQPVVIRSQPPAPPAFATLAAAPLASAQITTTPAMPVALREGAYPKPTAVGRPVFLQLGAFGEPANAQLLKQQVLLNHSALGQATQVLVKEGLHRVIVGPFVSVDQANEAAIELSAYVSAKPVVRDDLILP